MNIIKYLMSNWHQKLIMPGARVLDKSEVHEILKRIYTEKDRLNSNGNELPIDYACGWAISDDYKESTIQILFDRADSYMYKNKQLCKEQNLHSFQICGDIPGIFGDRR